MATQGFPESWDDYFFLSIQRRGSSAQSEVQFAAIVDPTSLTINEGEKAAESMRNAAGGSIWNQTPQADGEISFDIIPIELDSTSGIGLFQQYMGRAGNGDPVAYTTSEPLGRDTAQTTWADGAVRTRDRFRIAVLWTNDGSTAATAGGVTASATDSLRFYAHNCLFTNMEMNFTDGQLKATVTFKFKAFNKAGTTKGYVWESGDQTALTALAAYTTAGFPD